MPRLNVQSCPVEAQTLTDRSAKAPRIRGRLRGLQCLAESPGYERVSGEDMFCMFFEWGFIVVMVFNDFSMISSGCV